jgi:uncharacterized membrane protein YfcA
MLNRTILFNIFLTFVVWIGWFVYTSPDSSLIIIENWQVSITMVFGSFIAGATSEGGGAIAFPVFTKVLHIAALDAKVFSLAIQSIGMMAATLTIIVMRVSVEWRLVFWCSLGGVFGVVLGAGFLASLIPAPLLKMLFTAMITSFALTLALLNWQQRVYNKSLPVFTKREILILTLTGFFGGIMTGLVGNGIDIICFSVMVLLFRLTEKVSTPTSVVLMAINSVFGVVLHVFVIGGFSPQVQQYWLAAIPIVVVGAPLGAYFCTRLNNKSIAFFLIFLIFLELLSSLTLIPLTGLMASLSFAVFLVFSLIYYRMSVVTFYCNNNEGS